MSIEVYTGMSEEQAKKFCKDSVGQLAYPAVRALLKPGESLLDVACGNGIGACHYPAPGYLGVDISKPLIDVAVQEHPGHHFQVVTPGALPFTDASFDVTVCKSTLEHLANPDDAREMLEEVVRVSKRMAIVVWHMPPTHKAKDSVRIIFVPEYGRVFQNAYRKAPFIESIDKMKRKLREVTAGPHELWVMEPR